MPFLLALTSEALGKFRGFRSPALPRAAGTDYGRAIPGPSPARPARAVEPIAGQYGRASGHDLAAAHTGRRSAGTLCRPIPAMTGNPASRPGRPAARWLDGRQRSASGGLPSGCPARTATPWPPRRGRAFTGRRHKPPAATCPSCRKPLDVDTRKNLVAANAVAMVVPLVMLWPSAVRNAAG